MTINVRRFRKPIFVLDLLEGNIICNSFIMNNHYRFRWLYNAVAIKISLP